MLAVLLGFNVKFICLGLKVASNILHFPHSYVHTSMLNRGGVLIDEFDTYAVPPTGLFCLSTFTFTQLSGRKNKNKLAARGSFMSKLHHMNSCGTRMAEVFM